MKMNKSVIFPQHDAQSVMSNRPAIHVSLLHQCVQIKTCVPAKKFKDEVGEIQRAVRSSTTESPSGTFESFFPPCHDGAVFLESKSMHTVLQSTRPVIHVSHSTSASRSTCLQRNTRGQARKRIHQELLDRSSPHVTTEPSFQESKLDHSENTQNI